MLLSVKFPSASWKLPTNRKPVGRIRNISAKRKNGATPTQAQDTRSSPVRAPREGRAAIWSCWAIGRLLDRPLPYRVGRGGRQASEDRAGIHGLRPQTGRRG